MEDLSTLIAKSGHSSVEVDGVTTYSVFRLTPRSKNIYLELLSGPRSNLNQGIALLTRVGGLKINGQTAASVNLWSHSAPAVVPIELVGGAEAVSLWNIWEGPHAATMAWIGQAGMRVDKSGDSLILRCSAGPGSVDFSNLQVRVWPV